MHHAASSRVDHHLNEDWIRGADMVHFHPGAAHLCGWSVMELILATTNTCITAL